LIQAALFSLLVGDSTLALHYWMGDAHHCSGPRLRNDLYCVEWNVKP